MVNKLEIEIDKKKIINNKDYKSRLKIGIREEIGSQKKKKIYLWIEYLFFFKNVTVYIVSKKCSEIQNVLKKSILVTS